MLCAVQWTSQEHRERVLSELEAERQGKVEEHGPNPKKMHQIIWKNQRCTDPEDCPHTESWEHTVNDAYLAQACQGNAPNKPKTNAIKIAMQHFKEDQDAWVSARPWPCCLIRGMLHLLTGACSTLMSTHG
jgi:hypothetical protein